MHQHSSNSDWFEEPKALLILHLLMKVSDPTGPGGGGERVSVLRREDALQ